MKGLSFGIVCMGFAASLLAQEARLAVKTPASHRLAAAVREDAARFDFPFPSSVQERRDVPRRTPRTLADRSTCIVNHGCFCDGPVGTGGYCYGSSTCKPLVNNFCAYWCDSWQHCDTISAHDCENYGCGG